MYCLRSMSSTLSWCCCRRDRLRWHRQDRTCRRLCTTCRQFLRNIGDNCQSQCHIVGTRLRRCLWRQYHPGSYSRWLPQLNSLSRTQLLRSTLCNWFNSIDSGHMSTWCTCLSRCIRYTSHMPMSSYNTRCHFLVNSL